MLQRVMTETMTASQSTATKHPLAPRAVTGESSTRRWVDGHITNWNHYFYKI